MTQHQDNLQSKQRLRREISSHIEDFLHRGGRIEVITEHPRFDQLIRLRYRPTAADLSTALALPME